LQGWKNYYGKYGRAELKRVLFYLNEKLVKWAKKKYKRLKTERRAVRWILRHVMPVLIKVAAANQIKGKHAPSIRIIKKPCASK
jgi:hypothetical protein